MIRICRVEIRNFRSIQHLDWTPSWGINCLIGPGDSGKSSILDAIDLCLGARRSAPFNDTDFYNLDVANPISISLTIGGLPDSLKNLDTYGDFLRAYDSATQLVEDEPRFDAETVLTLRLTVASDLEPTWLLYSDRAETLGVERGLSWKDRTALTPARIGGVTNTNLSWARGSVLNRITDERPELGAELASAAREARASFGRQAGTQLAATLERAHATAVSLGVPVGAAVQALLDAHAVSIRDGAIALHSESGIPLRSLGTGSSRLLIAGLQRSATEAAPIALIDEVEFGLEPHRLVRLLHALGAKELPPPQQVFMTTHSPVALRELSGDQIFVVKRSVGQPHQVQKVGSANELQGAIRANPEAFLAKSIIVCEGASEVGFVRGLDLYWQSQNGPSFYAAGGALIDVTGGSPDRCFARGTALIGLGYRAYVLVDSDVPPTPAIRQAFLDAGGSSCSWLAGRALEDELFLSLPTTGVDALLSRAVELNERELVDDHIRSTSSGAARLASVENASLMDGYSPDMRAMLASASRRGKNSWFKSVTKFEGVARDIVGPHLSGCDEGFRTKIEALRRWMHATGD